MKLNLSREKDKKWRSALERMLHEIVDERNGEVELEMKR